MGKDVYAYPLVERTGLCNMFYPWARAVVWARDHGAQVIAPNWVQFGRMGVWLRREKDKRLYLNQFTDKGTIHGFRKWWLLQTQRRSSEECPLESGVVVFQGRDRWGWMEPVKMEREYLTWKLEAIVNPRILKALEGLPKEFIAVHIRKGDFNLGDELQTDSYYLNAIQKARWECGEKLPVHVFSDGTERELAFLAKVSNLVRMSKAPAVQDVLAISRATAVVGTNHSTFSYWGAFLGREKVSYWSSSGHLPSLPLDVCETRMVST